MSDRAAMREIAKSGDGTLYGIQLIESVDERAPFHIVPVSVSMGSAVSVEEITLAQVRWAYRVGYTVLTRDVPDNFAPYNAVIRMTGTEDRQCDYLAYIREAEAS